MIQYKIITTNDGHDIWGAEFEDDNIINFAKRYLPYIYSSPPSASSTPSLPSATLCTRLIAYKHLFLLLNEHFFDNKLKQLPQFSYINGKPYLTDFPNIHFSISHTNNAVAVAISSSPVGIDIECYRDIHSPRILQRVCNSADLEQIHANSTSQDFLRIWTIKESLVKANGCGIRVGLPSVLIDYENNTAFCNNQNYTFNIVNTDNLFDENHSKQFFCCLCIAN